MKMPGCIHALMQDAHDEDTLDLRHIEHDVRSVCVTS